MRNLQSVSLLPHPRLNVLTGINGSGKTSVLESLHLLGLGRSFRSGRARRLVNDEDSSCTVFATFASGEQAGIQRFANGETVLRLNGRNQVTLSEMAQCLPLLLLDPESMDLLDTGSKPRRALLDWGVFHVEHRFFPVWQRYQRALKQRNSLLRSGSIGRLESTPWHKELADSALQLHQFRLAYLERWQPVWEGKVQMLLPDFKLTLDYQAGWDTSLDLADLLTASWEKDQERGHTQLGAHRADLRVKLGTAAADEVLSRGQKKLLVCALRLSQVALLKADNQDCVLLVDDLASELDSWARQRLIDDLAGSGAQVFITCIESDAILPLLPAGQQGFKLFHVEHGTLREAPETGE